MAAADCGIYTEAEFRARVASNLRFPQYDGLVGSVANALSEAIDGRWRVKRLRRIVAEYDVAFADVLAHANVTIDEIVAYRRATA